MFSFLLKKSSNQMPRISAVILASGDSTRFGEDKIFSNILDYPCIYWSIKAFEDIECISEIIIVTKSCFIQYVNDMVKDYGFKKVTYIIKGGETRQKSAFIGFEHIDASSEYILIHDSARPLIHQEDIINLISDVVEKNACILGHVVNDTIKKVSSDNFIMKTLNRNNLCFASTPQAFSVKVYKMVFENAIENDLDFTDDCQLCENLGVKVHFTKALHNNMKITYPEDLILISSILENRQFNC